MSERKKLHRSLKEEKALWKVLDALDREEQEAAAVKSEPN